MQWSRRRERQGTREHKCQKKGQTSFRRVQHVGREEPSGKATSSIQHSEQEPLTSQELTKSFKL